VSRTKNSVRVFIISAMSLAAVTALTGCAREPGVARNHVDTQPAASSATGDLPEVVVVASRSEKKRSS
jgi:hypothetical protein